ncbi:hypothetical protein DMENIID0001_143040 [Sergentomyia squamirostris]
MTSVVPNLVQILATDISVCPEIRKLGLQTKCHPAIKTLQTVQFSSGLDIHKNIHDVNFSTRLAQPSDPLLDLKDGCSDQGSYANHQRDSTDSQDLYESLLEPVSYNQRIENSSQALSVNPTVKQVLDGILRWPEKKPTTRSRKTEDTPSVMTSDE